MLTWQEIFDKINAFYGLIEQTELNDKEIKIIKAIYTEQELQTDCQIFQLAIDILVFRGDFDFKCDNRYLDILNKFLEKNSLNSCVTLPTEKVLLRIFNTNTYSKCYYSNNFYNRYKGIC